MGKYDVTSTDTTASLDVSGSEEAKKAALDGVQEGRLSAIDSGIVGKREPGSIGGSFSQNNLSAIGEPASVGTAGPRQSAFLNSLSLTGPAPSPTPSVPGMAGYSMPVMPDYSSPTAAYYPSAGGSGSAVCWPPIKGIANSSPASSRYAQALQSDAGLHHGSDLGAANGGGANSNIPSLTVVRNRHPQVGVSSPAGKGAASSSPTSARYAQSVQSDAGLHRGSDLIDAVGEVDQARLMTSSGKTTATSSGLVAGIGSSAGGKLSDLVKYKPLSMMESAGDESDFSGQVQGQAARGARSALLARDSRRIRESKTIQGGRIGDVLRNEQKAAHTAKIGVGGLAAMEVVGQSDELEGFSKTARAAQDVKYGYKKAQQIRTYMNARKAQKTAATAAKAGRAAERAAKTAAGAAAGGAGGAAGSGGAAALGAMAPVLIIILSLIAALCLGTVILGAIGGGSASTTISINGLTDDEAEVAKYLSDKGFSVEAIAAIMGNIKNESGFDAASDENMDGMYNYAYERALGLFQFTHAASYPPSSTCTCEYCSFKRYCENNNLNHKSASVQMSWVFDKSVNAQGFWKNRWVTTLVTSGYYSNVPAYSKVKAYKGRKYYTADEFKDAEDVALATFSWMACYERPANGETSHFDRRLEDAEAYYKILSMGNASSYIEAALAMAADDSIGYSMANRELNPDVDCSSFVYYSLLKAGYSTDVIGSSPFSTESMGSRLVAAGFKKIAFSSQSKLKAGDICMYHIGFMGHTTGHTEIYLGNNKYVGAHSNYDDKSGDGAGDEVCTNTYSTRYWQWVYRLAA